MSDKTPALIAPNVASVNLKMTILERLITDDAAASAKTMGAPYGAILIGFIAVLANLVAKIDRPAAAEFFHAIWCKLKHESEASAEMDAARIDRAALALFQHAWRRAK